MAARKVIHMGKYDPSVALISKLYLFVVSLVAGEESVLDVGLLCTVVQLRSFSSKTKSNAK